MNTNELSKGGADEQLNSLRAGLWYIRIMCIAQIRIFEK